MSRAKKEVKLDLSAEIEVVITKDDKCKIQQMTFAHWLNLKKHPGFRYQAFQIGFHGYKQNV